MRDGRLARVFRAQPARVPYRVVGGETYERLPFSFLLLVVLSVSREVQHAGS